MCIRDRVSELLLFAEEQQEIVLKPLGGRAGLGVIRVTPAAASWTSPPEPAWCGDPLPSGSFKKWG